MDEVQKWANQLERSSWILVILGMMTQVSTEYAFPSYNVALGFWGAYCSFCRHGRATFGVLSFLFVGIILDIVFCSINSGETSTFQFGLVMLILCLFAKVYSLYAAAQFFAAIGGPYSLEQSMSGSAYDNLAQSDGPVSAGYYPPSSGSQMGSSQPLPDPLSDSGRF